MFQHDTKSPAQLGKDMGCESYLTIGFSRTSCRIPWETYVRNPIRGYDSYHVFSGGKYKYVQSYMFLIISITLPTHLANIYSLGHLAPDIYLLSYI